MSPTARKTEVKKRSQSPKQAGNFTKRVKHNPTIYQPQKNSMWTILRKVDPNKQAADLSDLKSVISKNDLSFGKDLVKDDENLSQHTFKSHSEARKSLAHSPSGKLFVSHMAPRSPTVLERKPLKSAARKIKVFQRDASPKSDSPAVVEVTVADKDTFAGSQTGSAENPFQRKKKKEEQSAEASSEP